MNHTTGFNTNFTFPTLSFFLLVISVSCCCKCEQGIFQIDRFANQAKVLCMLGICAMATLHCNFIHASQSSFVKLSLPRISPSFGSNCASSASNRSNKSRQLSTRRLERFFSAVVTGENAVISSASTTADIKLTYLEGNSWLWDVDGLKVLVDPILVGNLDFGIPWLYDASKRFLRNFQLDDLPEVDCLLITQSLDDHCHVKTLKPLSVKCPNVRVISTPNAKDLLDPLFMNVMYLEPGQDTEIIGRTGSKVQVRATPGPVLGPPWQRPENGYFVSSMRNQVTLYYEPHCVYNEELLKNKQADIVITPVIKQLLPSFTLVSGQEDAVKLANLLDAKFIVPMKNGDLDAKGLLVSMIQAEGTLESFKELLSKNLPNAQVLEPIPGVPLEVPALSISKQN
ncbi:hypothetical protein Drorol1_Dr00012712 [Drosera rotundifolia]